jgi:hypothetical protein
MFSLCPQMLQAEILRSLPISSRSVASYYVLVPEQLVVVWNTWTIYSSAGHTLSRHMQFVVTHHEIAMS